MRRLALAAVLLAAASGCVLRHVESDTDAARYATAWETPRLKQQPVLFEFKTEGDCDQKRLMADALAVLRDSGRFRLATTEDEPAYKIEVTVSVRRDTHVFKTVCNALILYAWPIDAQDYVCEAFAVIREPSGRVVERCYAQGRGHAELWLGYLLWPKWITNRSRADAIHRDTLKAATTKMCDALMPRAPK